MSGTSNNSKRKTLLDSRNAISSPGLESGVTPCVSPDGPTLDLFGQAVAPARVSQPQAKAAGLMTLATSGRLGSDSSASAALQRSLENRLMQRLDTAGSTLYKLTWRAKRTPLGRRYLERAARERRTSGSGCTSWPSPGASEHDMSPQEWERQNRAQKANNPLLHEKQKMLSTTAQLSAWPTPNCPTGGPNTESTETHTGGMDLDGAMRLASWATPQVHDDKLRGNTMADHHDSPHDLSNQALLASWNTPTSEDTKTDGPKAMRKWEDHRQTGAGLPTSVQRLRNQAQALAAWPSPIRDSAARRGHRRPPAWAHAMREAYFFLSKPTVSRADSRLFSIPSRNSWNFP